jgi:hypothetical protein
MAWVCKWPDFKVRFQASAGVFTEQRFRKGNRVAKCTWVLHPHHENQIHGPHCQGGHWDWTPSLQYQQRGWVLSKSWKLLIGSLKTFGTWRRCTWRCSSIFLSLFVNSPTPFTNSRHYLLPPLLSASSIRYSILTLPFSHRSMHRLLVTANAVPSSQILIALMMEAVRSCERSDLTRAKWHSSSDLMI